MNSNPQRTAVESPSGALPTYRPQWKSKGKEEQLTRTAALVTEHRPSAPEFPQPQDSLSVQEVAFTEKSIAQLRYCDIQFVMI